MITLDRLQQIIPADQALANKALSVALSQIAGVKSMELPQLAAAVSGVETTKDLPLVTALTTAVPPSVANYYTSTLAVGGGSNGDIQLVNILGIAAGWGVADVFTQTVAIFAIMDLSELTLIYQTMSNVLDGTYDSGVDPDGFTIITIPSGLPGAGTYTPVTEPNPDPPPPNIETESAADQAMAVLIPLAETEIANLQATYPTQTTELNTLWNSIITQINSENSLQTLIKLVWADLTANDRNSIYGFVYNLPSYGLDTKVGGTSWFIENISDLTILGGEAIVGCLRQGRNQAVLNAAGVYLALTIPSEPVPPPPEAELIPSTYSETEAKNQVIS